MTPVKDFVSLPTTDLFIMRCLRLQRGTSLNTIIVLQDIIGHALKRDERYSMITAGQGHVHTTVNVDGVVIPTVDELDITSCFVIRHQRMRTSMLEMMMHTNCLPPALPPTLPASFA